jgi:hypothetical protein
MCELLMKRRREQLADAARVDPRIY